MLSVPVRWKVAATLARVLGAGIWLAAAAHKLVDLHAAVNAVRAFQLFPHALATGAGYLQPFVELAFGLLLALGLFTRSTAVATIVFNLVYIAGISSVAARGLRIDCGCFSHGGPLPAGVPTQYTADIVRDSVFILITLILVWRPLTYLSLDSHLAARRSR